MDDRSTKTGRRRWMALLHMTGLLLACDSTVDDNIAALARGGDAAASAEQELILANERAIAPLVTALEQEADVRTRMRLVEVLASLMMRVDDARIAEALSRQLHRDASADVRATIARRFGMYKATGGAVALLQALEDSEAQVRFESLQALGMMDDKLDTSQLAVLRDKAHSMLDDPHDDTRLEAQIRVEWHVDDWVKQAQEHEVRSELARAESLYQRALTFSPHSKRGSYRFARFTMDNGDPEKGMGLLREQGMLLDVPRMTAPIIDGRLGDSEWQGTARVDSFLVLATQHYATFPSQHRARLHLGYTSEALYAGFYGYDAHPESLVVRRHAHDDWKFAEDIVELFVDANFDHSTYGQIGINSIGVVSDAYESGSGFDRDWNSQYELMAYVGDDFWSFEIRLPFDQPNFTTPKPGDLWGFNAARVFRGAEYAQWVRTFFNAHSPNDFGVLRFE